MHKVTGGHIRIGVAGLGAVSVGYALSCTLNYQVGYIGLYLMVIFTLCVGLLLSGRTAERDALAPLRLVAFVYALYYVSKGFYILHAGFYSAGAPADAEGLGSAALSALAYALILVICSLAFIFMGAVLANLRHKEDNVSSLPIGYRADKPYPPASLSIESSMFLLTSFSVLAIASFAYLIGSSGGFGAYISGLALRSSFFAGKAFVTLANLPLKLTLLVVIQAFLSDRLKLTSSLKRLIIFGSILTCTTDVLTGGRAALLLQTLLPLLVLYHYLRRRLNLFKLLALALVGAALLFTMASYLRTSTFAKTSAEALEDVNGAQGRTSKILGGQEVVPLDSLITLVRAQALEDPPRQDGRTYLSIATWPIPRALWAGKPSGGGNTWFTENYLPRYYGTAHVETSISFIGESFANFGPLGVGFLSLVFGYWIQRAYLRIRTNAESHYLVYYSVGLGYAISFVRGDAYHNATLCLFSFAIIAVIRRILRSRINSRSESSNSRMANR